MKFLNVKFILLTILVLEGVHSFAQSIPRGITYQAVAIDTRGKQMPGFDMTGQPIPNQSINIRFEILKGSENGEVHYAEQHETETDQYGQFTVVIGQGIPNAGEVASFSEVEWGVYDFFIKVYIDLENNQEFLHLATQQLMAVPYSFYAEQAGNGIQKIETNANGDHTFTYYNGWVVKVAGADNQHLQLTGDSLRIEEGNSVFLPDLDSTNEVQVIDFRNDTLFISKANQVYMGIYRQLVDSLVRKVQADSAFQHKLTDSLAMRVWRDSLHFERRYTTLKQKLKSDSLHWSQQWIDTWKKIETDSQYFETKHLQSELKRRIDSNLFESHHSKVESRIGRDSLHFETSMGNVNARISADSVFFSNWLNTLVNRVNADSTFFSSEVQFLSRRIGTDSNLMRGLIQQNLSRILVDSQLFHRLIVQNQQNIQSDSLYYQQWLSTLQNRVTADSVLLRSIEIQILKKISSDSLKLSQTVTNIIHNQSNDSLYFQGIADRQEKTIDSLVTEVAKDFDRSATNELQKLNLSGNNLSLDKNGGSVSLSLYLDNTDNQDLSNTKIDNRVTVNISNGQNTSFSVADGDSSTTNELQTISKNGHDIRLSNNGGVVSLKEYSDSLDAQNRRLVILSSRQKADSFHFESKAKTVNDSLASHNTRLLTLDSRLKDSLAVHNSKRIAIKSQLLDSVANHNSQLRTVSKRINDSFLVHNTKLETLNSKLKKDSLYFKSELAKDGDKSATNEIQTISKNGDNISLSNSGGTVSLKEYRDSINALNDRLQFLDSIRQVDSIHFGSKLVLDNDTSAINEIQSLSISGDTLFLNRGGHVKLPDKSSADNDTSGVNELQTFFLRNDSLILSNGGGGIPLDSLTKNIVNDVDAGGTFSSYGSDAINIGGTKSNVAEDVEFLSDGSYVITGRLHGTLNFVDTLINNVSTQAFMARFNQNGSLVWIRLFSTGSYSYKSDVDSLDNIYIVGQLGGKGTVAGLSYNLSHSGGFVLKIDKNGIGQWIQTLTGSTNNSGWLEEVSVKGNRLSVSGRFWGTVGLGNKLVSTSAINDQDVLVAQLNTLNGTVSWMKSGGMEVYVDYVSSLEINSLGEVYLSGIYRGHKGDIAKFGSLNLASSSALGINGPDGFIIKYDASGKEQVGKVFKKAGVKCVLKPNGNLMVFGNYYSDSNYEVDSITLKNLPGKEGIFTSEFNDNLDVLWAKELTYPGVFTINDLCVREGGQLYLAGSFYNSFSIGNQQFSNTGNYDAFVLGLDSVGNYLWFKQGVGAGTESANGLAINANNLVTVGHMLDNTAFGSSSLAKISTSASHSDIFIWSVSVKNKTSGSSGVSGSSQSGIGNQKLNLVGNVLSLSNGGSVTLPTGNTNDTSATNEIQALSKAGDDIRLSKGGGSVSLKEYRDSLNTHSIKLQALVTKQKADSLYFENKLVTDNDKSSTNEIQALSISNDTIFLSNGGFVKLPTGSGSSSSNSDTAKHLNFSPTPSSGNANSIGSIVTIDANNQGLGAPLYITSAGTYKTTDADDGTSMPCVALALETGTGSKRVIFYGFITNNSWNWTVGQRIYVHTNTGEMTQTPPSGTGDHVQVVGFATAAKTMMFNPDSTLINLK